MERGGSNGSQKKKQNPPTSDFECPPPSPMREQDQYMPIANVIRIMRRTLPSHAKISDDTKETIQECVSEFISFVTGEANERCQREQRKTITAEDVLWAMAKLGFDNYVDPLTVYLSRHREVESHHTPYLNSTGARPSLGPAYDQQRYHQHHHSMEFHRAPGVLDGGAAMGGFYRDPTGEGGSSTSYTALPSFDPYAPYK